MIIPEAHAQMVNIGIEFPFGKISSLGEAISYLVTPAFEIAALAVVIYFAYGSFRWVMSKGDKEEVAKARAMMTHSVIGFVLLMLMFLIIQFVQMYFIGGIDTIRVNPLPPNEGT